jgi:hypothetical protein
MRNAHRDKCAMLIPAKRLCVTSEMSGAASNPDLLSRAYAAYFRSGGVDLPSNTSDVIVFGGKTYAVLRNVNGILGIYRLLKSGQLRRLRRYPVGLDRAV